MKPKIRIVRLNSMAALALFVGCSLVSSPALFAGTLYWDANGAAADSGTPAAGTWDAGTNWSTDLAGTTATTAWVNGESAIFSAGAEAAGTWTITLAGTVQTNSITFTGTANTVHNINGGTINIGSSPLTITSSAAGAGSGRSKNIASKITGSGGLVLAVNGDTSNTGGGSNTYFTLSGATNDFTGGVSITSGVVDARSIFGAASNAITLNGGGLVAPVVATVPNDIVAGSGGVLRAYGAVGAFTLAGNISGSGALTHTDGGTLVFSGGMSGFSGAMNNETGSITFANTSSPTGAININAGSISVGNNGTVGTLNSASAATIKSGTSLYVRRTDTVSATQILPATISLLAGSNFELNPNVSTAVLNLDRDLGVLPTLPADRIPGQIRIAGGTLKLTNGTDVVAGTIGLALQDNTNRGVLEIGSGSTLTTETFDIGAGGGNSGTINQTGGTVTMRPLGFFRIGHWNNNANAGSVYNLTGGTLDATALSANAGEERMVNIGWDGQGDMTVGGGSGVATLKAFGIQLDGKGDGGGSTGSNMTLTVSTNGVVEVGTGGIGGAGAGDKLFLNGGTLNATGNSTWAPMIQANPSTTSTINTNGSNVTLPLAKLSGTGTLNLSTGAGSLIFDSGTTDSTLLPVLSGMANLTKIGTGSLTIPTTNTLSGTISVNAGTLNLTGSLGGTTLSAGAGSTISGEGSANGGLVLAGASLLIDPSTPGALATTGAVTLTGTNTITLSKAVPLGASSVTVLKHGGTLNGALGTNLVLANASSFRGASLSNVSNSIVASFSTLDLVWSGTGGTTWDVGTTQNWSNGSASSFYWMDRVLFGDAGAGTVNLSTELSPGLVTVASANNYTFSGTGSLTGATSIVKSGAGTLTLGTANSYLGTTTVSGGILKLGNAAALGSAVAGTTIEAGATLDVNGQDLGLGTEAITVSGTGVGGNGAIINTGVTRGVLRSVTLAADSTIKIDTGKSLAIGQNVGNGTAQGTLSLGSNTLTKAGAGELVLNGVNVISGNITVNEGTLGLMCGYTTAAGHVNFGQQPTTLSGTGTLRINVGATLTTNRWNAPLNLSMPMVLNGGTFSSTWPGPNGSTISSPINVTADSAIKFEGGGYGNATFSGVISGGGKLTFNGTDQVVLTGTNTYAGGTLLSSGRVAFNADSLGTGNVTMNGGSLIWNGTNTQDISSKLVMVAAKTATFNTGANAVVFANPIGSGVATGVTKQGTGSLKLVGVSTYTGATTISEGSLILSGGTNPLPAATAAVTLGAAATSGKLVLGGSDQTLASLSGNGTGNAIVGGSPTLSILRLDVAANASLEASLGGSGTDENNLALVKSGTGNLTLKGTHTLTGATTINGGGLGLKGDTPNSPVTVSGTGMLFGGGALASLSVATGGTVAPGDLAPNALDQLVRTAVGAATTVTLTGDFQELHNTTGTVVPGNTTYSYTGEVYLPGAAGTIYYFAENFDDTVTLSIGTTSILTANGWDVVGAGNFTSTGPGWYPIKLTAGQGGGGVGPTTANGWGPGKGVGFTTVLPATATDGAAYEAFTVANLATAGIKLRTGDSTNTFSSASSVTLAGTYVCDVEGAESDKLVITGDLDLTGSTLVVSGAPERMTEQTYVIASYTGTLTGTFGSVTGMPAGYLLGYNVAANQIELNRVPSGYGPWVDGFTDFFAPEPEDDQDEDGLINLMEYVLGGDPRFSSSDVLPTQQKVGPNLVFSYKRKVTSRMDTLQRVQWSVDMVTWNSITVTAGDSPGVDVTEHDGGPDDVSVSIPLGNPQKTKLFVRLKVTKL